MKKYKNNLDTILENLLNEADPIVRPTSISDFQNVPQDVVSLDQMIDRYFVQYERESIPTSEMYENFNINNLTDYLFEQEEIPGLDLSAPETEKKDDNLDLSTLDDDVSKQETSEEKEEEKQPIMQIPNINLSDFTRNIARITNNFQSLIDFKSIILNRAKKYIQNNYNEKTAKEMMEILKTSYDLEPVNTTTHHITGTENPRPSAAVTGPIAGG